MKVRLGTTQIGLGRYLGMWGVIVVAFTWQTYMHDDLTGHTGDVVDYLRWNIIQWYTGAALAPLVVKLGEHYPILVPLRLAELWVPLFASIGMTGLALLIGAMVSTLF
ncbi:hypothetical protein [Luteibacter sp.]|uniref:hypothetical protein n=1 Tax=Luteibacter sp. TaxID=1886636 RepID=UPI003F7CEB34